MIERGTEEAEKGNEVLGFLQNLHHSKKKALRGVIELSETTEKLSHEQENAIRTFYELHNYMNPSDQLEAVDVKGGAEHLAFKRQEVRESESLGETFKILKNFFQENPEIKKAPKKAKKGAITDKQLETFFDNFAIGKKGKFMEKIIDKSFDDFFQKAEHQDIQVLCRAHDSFKPDKVLHLLEFEDLPEEELEPLRVNARTKLKSILSLAETYDEMQNCLLKTDTKKESKTRPKGGNMQAPPPSVKEPKVEEPEVEEPEVGDKTEAPLEPAAALSEPVETLSEPAGAGMATPPNGVATFPKVLPLKDRINLFCQRSVKDDLIYLSEHFDFRFVNHTKIWYKWLPIKPESGDVGCWEKCTESDAEQRFAKVWEEADGNYNFSLPYLATNPEGTNTEASRKLNARYRNDYMKEIKKVFTFALLKPKGLNFSNGFWLLPDQPHSWGESSCLHHCDAKDVLCTSLLPSPYEPQKILSSRCFAVLKAWSLGNWNTLVLLRLFLGLALNPNPATQTGLFLSGGLARGKGSILRLVKTLLGPLAISLTENPLSTRSKDLSGLYHAHALVWEGLDLDQLKKGQLSALTSLLGRDTPFRGTVFIDSNSGATAFYSEANLRDRFFTINLPVLRGSDSLSLDFELALNSDPSGLVNWALTAPKSDYEHLIRSGQLNLGDLANTSMGSFVVTHVMRNETPLKKRVDVSENTTKHFWDRYADHCKENSFTTVKRTNFEDEFFDFLNNYCSLGFPSERVRKDNSYSYKGISLISLEGPEVSKENVLTLSHKSLELNPFTISPNCYYKACQEALSSLANS